MTDTTKGHDPTAALILQLGSHSSSNTILTVGPTATCPNRIESGTIRDRTRAARRDMNQNVTAYFLHLSTQYRWIIYPPSGLPTYTEDISYVSEECSRRRPPCSSWISPTSSLLATDSQMGQPCPTLSSTAKQLSLDVHAACDVDSCCLRSGQPTNFFQGPACSLLVDCTTATATATLYGAPR